MDFFQAQEEARRKTGLLVLYFVIAVTLLIIAVYLAVLMVAGEPGGLWRPDLLFLSGIGTVLLVGGGTAYKVVSLASGGGASVAESLGGRRVARESGDLAERRLLNVVEEMAIASGVPVPPVYVLDDEAAINAFAAGVSANEAVIAVTRGTLEQLSRDELQGVIAHEFSHVLNGDMRLNLRLIGVLHGILLLTLVGRGLLRGGRGRGRNAGGSVAFGLALVLIGYIGVFFGRLIKAAVSRQREYLADASAVQFTRNPAGIAGALKKIAGVTGSLVLHPKAEEASHLFFGQGLESFLDWFATHPPIEERIGRLDPSFNPELVHYSTAGAAPLNAQAFAASAGTVSAAHTAYAREFLTQLPETVQAQVHNPDGARAVIYGLLLSADSGVAEAQGGIIAAREGDSMRAAVEDVAAWARGAGTRSRLPLVDLALPALAQSDEAVRTLFLEVTALLVRADGKLDLFEYTLQRILNRHLTESRWRARPRSHDLRAIRESCELLWSALAYSGHRTAGAASASFDAATALAPLEGPWNLTPKAAMTLAKVDEALTQLAGVPPRFKRKLVEACAAAVLHDGTVAVGEGELLRAVCEALEVPIPPLVATLHST